MGYFAYAMIEYAEPTLTIKRGDFDDLHLMLFDRVIAFDHLRQKICFDCKHQNGCIGGELRGGAAGDRRNGAHHGGVDAVCPRLKAAQPRISFPS